MSNGNSVLSAVESAICSYDMISRGDRVLAAVSGGADSVCMLHALYSLKDKLGFKLYCAHLNHGLRGEDADRDEKFVADMCGRLGIKFFSKKLAAGYLSSEKGVTVEEAGRNARYEFFDELRQKHKLDKLATAHNKNDNVETVLMRILRGTGIDGLGGIPRVRADGVVRPLLEISRAEIEEYCVANGLEFCTDKTNFENDYTRNKIRNELLPYLEKNFGGASAAISRLSETAAADASFLNEYAERLYARLGSPMTDKKMVVLHAESLKMIRYSVASRVVRIAADKAMQGVRLEKKHVDSVLSLLDKETGAAADLPCGLRAELQYGWVHFESGDCGESAALCDENGFFAELEVGGCCVIESLNKKISLRTEKRDYKPKINETVLDFEQLEGKQLFLRNRRSGDRMVRFADGRTKKIKNILIDAKISRRDRDKIPLLCTGNEVLAVVGLCVSEKYRIKKSTERILVIEYGTGEKYQNTDR